jgi:hypothetical protein
MSEDWLRKFNGTPGLKELVVEYETITMKKAQLDAIVARNKHWRLRVQHDGHLSAENTALQEWRWHGPSRLGGRQWEHHGEASTIEYVVVTDRWVYVDGPIPEGDQGYVQEYSDVDTDDLWSDPEDDGVSNWDESENDIHDGEEWSGEDGEDDDEDDEHGEDDNGEEGSNNYSEHDEA